MRILTTVLSFIILFTLSACKEDVDKTSAHDAPQRVVVSPDKYRSYGSYEGLPSKLTDILETLEFNEANLTQKELGYPPEQKIKFFDVKAYVEYKDGWLLASGYGEWGGVVFWIDQNGHYEIIRDDDLAYPIDVMVDGSAVLISQGMSHLTLSEGHLLELNRNDGAFETNVYPINLYPHKFEKLDGKWIIPVGDNQTYFDVTELRAEKHIRHNRK